MKRGFAMVTLTILTALFIFPVAHAPSTAFAQDKVKLLYHVDGKDPEVAKYAMALIYKHIGAEGGPENIDVKVVVHGPALHQFKEESVDPMLKKRLKTIIDKGVDAEMCQVSMKLFGTPLEKLVAGFKPTEHPVAVSC